MTTSVMTMSKHGQYKKEPPFNIFPGVHYRATIKTERAAAWPLPEGEAGPPYMIFTPGEMVFDLMPIEAPKNVNSFVFLAREGFYRRTVFHRVIPGLLLQGGCPLGDGTGGPGYHVHDEEVTRPYVRGTLAMASAGRNKNGSQFFIVASESISFPPNYTIFGRLVEGEEVLQELSHVEVDYDLRGERCRPLDRLAIVDIDITETPMRR